MDFKSFISSFSTNSCVADNAVAEYVYSEIIWNETNRIKMADLSDAKKPALIACASQIEDYCKKNNNALDLTNDTVKQTIGRMIAESLAPLGYTKITQTRIPKVLNLEYFVSSSVFEYTGDETQKIVKKIVNI